MVARYCSMLLHLMADFPFFLWQPHQILNQPCMAVTNEMFGHLVQRYRMLLSLLPNIRKPFRTDQ